MVVFHSCSQEKQLSSVNPERWETRKAILSSTDSLIAGVSYLSVYSQIYSQSEDREYSLTATVSIRNISRTDTLYLNKAEYFDTKGTSIRNYFNDAIYVAPLETVEIVIDESDRDGGSGANFIFEWMKVPYARDPLFEAVMISTSSQLGISFTTTGHTTY